MRFLFSVTVFAVIFFSTECKLRTSNCKGVNVSIRQALCTPRPMLENLAPDPDWVFDPSIVQVNRCSGNCEHNSCLPLEFKNVTHVVRRYKRNSSLINNVQCVALEIEEHEKCDCMCRTKPEDCHINQKYDGQNCKCICPNQMEKKKECEKKMGMEWMENICDCKCMMLINECTSGHMWDHMICECVPNRRS